MKNSKKELLFTIIAETLLGIISAIIFKDSNMAILITIILGVFVYIITWAFFHLKEEIHQLKTDIEFKDTINDRKFQFLYRCIEAGKLLPYPEKFLTEKEIDLFTDKRMGR